MKFLNRYYEHIMHMIIYEICHDFMVIGDYDVSLISMDFTVEIPCPSQNRGTRLFCLGAAGLLRASSGAWCGSSAGEVEIGRE